MRFLVSLIIVLGLAVLTHSLGQRRSAVGLLLISYTIAVLIITLGSRSFDHETHISWNPVVVYERVIQSVCQGWKAGGWAEAIRHLGWHKGQLSSVGLNILLFVPLGYLVPSLSFFFRRWWKVLLLGLACSLLIEVVQLITHLGWFDTSDLLHNTLGAVIGYRVYWRWLRENAI